MNYYSFNLTKVGDVKTLVNVPLVEENKNLFLTFRYNMIGEFWSMTVTDGTTQQDLIAHIPLVSGMGAAQNLLRQFGHMDIGSAYVVNLVDYPSTDSPNYKTWLQEFDLWWGDESA